MANYNAQTPHMQQHPNPQSAMTDNPAHPSKQTQPKALAANAADFVKAHAAAFSWMPATHTAIDLRQPEF